MENYDFESDCDDSLELVSENDQNISELKLCPEMQIQHSLFTWMIENFSLMPRDGQKCITSPPYDLEKVSTTWYINFYPFHEVNNRNEAKFCLLRDNNHGPDVVAVTYRIGVGIGNISWLPVKRKIRFKVGEFDFTKIVGIDFSQYKMFKNGMLTVFCEMYAYEVGNETQSDITSESEFWDLIGLSKDFYSLIENPQTSDMVIEIRDIKIPAHKAVLSARSPIFEAMLSASSKLELPQEDYAHIYDILLYAYSGNSNLLVLKGNICIGLCECANRYSINGLSQLLSPTKITVCSSLVTEKLNFTWVIEKVSHFTPGQCISSRPFTNGSENSASWCMDFFLEGQTADGIGIFVRTFDNFQALDINVYISILNENMQELSVRHTNKPWPFPSIYGFEKFMQKDQLTQDSDFLFNDKLYVNCKIMFTVHNAFYRNTSLFSFTSSPELLYSQCIAKDFGQLLDSKRLTDVKLVIDDSIISAHKCILSARSAVFASMFKSSIEEECVVSVAGIGADVLEAMIDYAYTGKLKDITKTFATSLYKAAHEYKMYFLVSRCRTFLETKIDPQNLFTLIILCHTYKDSLLMSKCLQFFKQNEDQILSSSAWKSFLKNESKIAFKLLQWLSKANGSELNRSV